MARLIDADALIDAYCNGCTHYRDKICRAAQRCDFESFCNEYINTMPTIDVEPMRHGKWTADEILYTQGMTACSCCKTEYYRDDLYMVGNNAQGELPNYCPNCGARMDKDD